MKQLFGNTSGLKASVSRSAQRLYRRRVQPSQIVSYEFAKHLCQVSSECKRQVGVLLDRRGQIDHVIVGDAARLWLPDVGRLRAGRGRLRGLRLVHTHLKGEGLSSDDLTDLSLLRLDLVVAITTNEGTPGMVHCAHLLPENPGKELWTQLDPVPAYNLSVDFRELIRSLEEEFARASRVQRADGGQDRALLVHLRTRRSRRPEQTCLVELKDLCRTAGVVVLDVAVQQRYDRDPKYMVGRGKVEELVQRANQMGAQMLVFDQSLTPAQARAISDITELKVIDRNMLILDIFAQRARSRDGKIQVELAQLKYTLPRLVAKNTMMSRLMGGIGGRGPGETKLEVNRRRARDRIARLERQIRELSKRRGLRRSLRQRRGLPVVSIMGYTNAGKSTLLNTLTRSTVLVEDKLFATLDPKTARLRFPKERALILTDTVGFIHDLPEELVNAFRATLEEVGEADLLVHLVDISDDNYEEQMTSVLRLVNDLGMAGTPRLLVFNKQDALDEEERLLRAKSHDAICLSATDKESTRPLLERMERMLWEQRQ